MQNQINPYLNEIFSKYQCSFRARFNAKSCFMAMIEKQRNFFDKGSYVDARLTNVPKSSTPAFIALTESTH